MIKKFNNLQEITDYYKHCIICNKSLNLFIKIYTTNYGQIQTFCLNKGDFYYIGANKDHKLYLDIITNEINLSFTPKDRLSSSRSIKNADIFLKCKTCDNSILFKKFISNGCNYNLPIEPYLQTVKFNLSKLEKITIMSYVSSQQNNYASSIWINNTLLHFRDLDLNKFKNFKQLVKKIKLIKTFQ